MLHTPLEQFQIILLFSIKLFCFDFSITNLALVNLLVLAIFAAMVFFFSSNVNYLKETSFFFIPNTWQVFVEALYETSAQLLFDNINAEGEKYFPFISVIFTFVLFSNLIGLVPYSFTTTSHLIVTFTLSLSIYFKTSCSPLLSVSLKLQCFNTDLRADSGSSSPANTSYSSYCSFSSF